MLRYRGGMKIVVQIIDLVGDMSSMEELNVTASNTIDSVVDVMLQLVEAPEGAWGGLARPRGELVEAAEQLEGERTLADYDIQEQAVLLFAFDATGMLRR